MESIVGQTVSHYAFLEKLGAGGMGEIYKARDSRLNRIVAVKVLAPGMTRDPERRRRFIQEAQAASALNHPNIITIHDILPEGDTQYMVMEHVAGKTLHELIQAGKLPASQVLQLAIQMANALGAAHAAGIVHRDFKPANVMVTGSGLVKVLDFGLAKLTDPSSGLRGGDFGETQDGVTVTNAPLTVEGTIMGTVSYMSPEQAEGLKVDSRSDIFSFGAVLYEMVTGHRAFDGDSGISTLSAVLRDDVKPIRQVAPEVPVELDGIIARCLRKSPGERWQTMAEVSAALSSLRARLDSGVLQSPPATKVFAAPAQPSVGPASTGAPVAPVSSVAPTPVAAPAPKNRKVVLLGATSVAVVALAVAVAWWQTHRQQANPQPPTPAVTVAPPPQPTPPPAATPPVEPAASTDQVAKNEAPPTPVPAVAAPPPPARVALPTTKARTPAPPPTPVPVTKGPTQPLAVTTPAPVETVAPAPHAAPPEVVAAKTAVKLNDGLPFRIALMEDVPLDVEAGHSLRFRVLDGLQSGDVLVIAKGAIVSGTVAALGGKRGFFGGGSKVRFRLISAESVDDTKINVRATPAAKTDSGEARPFETPNGLKDKTLVATNGTEYIAYVAGDQTVMVRK